MPSLSPLLNAIKFISAILSPQFRDIFTPLCNRKPGLTKLIKINCIEGMSVRAVSNSSHAILILYHFPKFA